MFIATFIKSLLFGAPAQPQPVATRRPTVAGNPLQEMERAGVACRKIGVIMAHFPFTEIVGFNLNISRLEEPQPNKKEGEQANPYTFEYLIWVRGSLAEEMGLQGISSPLRVLVTNKDVVRLYSRLKSLYISCGKNSIVKGDDNWPTNDVSFEDTICCLCYGSSVEYWLDCDHAFCGKCLNSWVVQKENKQCPNCRAPVKIKPSNSGKPSTVDGFKIITEAIEDREFNMLHQRVILTLKACCDRYFAQQ